MSTTPATSPSHTGGEPEPIIRDLQAVVDAATAAADGTLVEEGEYAAFVVPPGSSLAFVNRDTDDERRAAGRPPSRSVAGTSTVRDEASLIELARRWGEPSKTVVYADPVDRNVVAVLDDDHDARGEDSGGEVYGWRDRRVRLALTHTPEWLRWAALDRKMVPQQAFAEHVEACLEDIRTPPAADMLELAQSLEANVGVQFQSATRLQDGQRQFTYREEQQASAGRNGQLTVPEEFELALTPWQGRDARPFSVTARLRYRISQNGLTLGYVLKDVDRILRAAFEDDVVGPIRAADLTVVHGTP